MGSVGETMQSMLVKNWEEVTQRSLNVVLFPNRNGRSKGLAVSTRDQS